MNRFLILMIGLGAAGCVSPMVTRPPALQLAYAPTVFSYYVAGEALAKAEEAENEIRIEQQAAQHKQMLRATWGIETEPAAPPLVVKPHDLGTEHELGTWDH
jgi:hypothetical protein